MSCSLCCSKSNQFKLTLQNRSGKAWVFPCWFHLCFIELHPQINTTASDLKSNENLDWYCTSEERSCLFKPSVLFFWTPQSYIGIRGKIMLMLVHCATQGVFGKLVTLRKTPSRVLLQNVLCFVYRRQQVKMALDTQAARRVAGV